jgi:hypothetical protein
MEIEKALSFSTLKRIINILYLCANSNASEVQLTKRKEGIYKHQLKNGKNKE